MTKTLISRLLKFCGANQGILGLERFLMIVVIVMTLIVAVAIIPMTTKPPTTPRSTSLAPR